MVPALSDTPDLAKVRTLLMVHEPRLTPLRDEHERVFAEMLSNAFGPDQWVIHWLEWSNGRTEQVSPPNDPFLLVISNITPPSEIWCSPKAIGVIKLGRLITRVPPEILESGTPPVVAVIGDSFATTCAEHTLALTMGLLRRIPAMDAKVRRGENPRALEAIETSNVIRRPNWLGLDASELGVIEGKRVGIVGLGEIGYEAARRFLAFDAEVVYTQRTRLTADQEHALGLRWADLEELVATSDIVSLHLEYSPALHHFIDTAKLALMKPDAILVNTARGGLVDEVAVAQALEERRLGGAAFDVFPEEPPATSTPTFASERVLLSPHIGTYPTEVGNRYRTLVEQLRRLEAEG